MLLPVSPDARIRPLGDHRTMLTEFWCLERSHKHWGSTLPSLSTTSSHI